MRRPDHWHRLPPEWRPVFDPQTQEFLSYAHVHPCHGAIIITPANPFGSPLETALCDACTCTWSRTDARHTWRREE